MQDTLTKREYWDRQWESLELPVAHDLENGTGLALPILKFFEGVLARRPPKTVLEVGGAPGGYLAYFARHYGSEIHAMDYSEAGCKKTEENFRILGCPITVHRRDIFAVEEGFPKFDLVYSLGLIEHFADPLAVVKAHRNLMKVDGTMILGVPHFMRVFWPILSLLAPRVTHGHNYETLALENWSAFERYLGLKPLAKSYMGGFGLGLMAEVIGSEHRLYGDRFWPIGKSIVLAIRLAAALSRRAKWIVPPRLIGMLRIEGKGISSYCMGAYSAIRDDGIIHG